jgi:hypothetical protein
MLDRETRVGGGASVRLFQILVLEGGATGDFSERTQGVTPEVSLAIEMPNAKGSTRAYALVSRRYERRGYDGLRLGYVGGDVEDLSRLSRTMLRCGLRYEETGGAGFWVEGARREIAGTYRYILDQDVVDGLDSLYFLNDDVATEINSGATFRVGQGLSGRLTARGGLIRGERVAVISQDEATYAMLGTAIQVLATQTTVGVGYRNVSQTFSRADTEVRNDLSAIDFSLTQTIPIAALRSFGSELRALVTLELGTRREGTSPERANKQLAGGLSFAF